MDLQPSDSAQFRRRVLHSIESTCVRFEVVVDDYRQTDERLILNARHSVAARLSVATGGHAWLDGETDNLASFGDVVFIPANVPLYVRGGGTKVKLARLEFCEDQFPILTDVLGCAPIHIGHLVNMKGSSIARMLQVLALEAEAPQAASDLYLNGMSAVIVAELIRQLTQPDFFTSGVFQTGVDPRIERAAGFVEEYLGDKISVASIANIYDMSERQVSRLFRQLTGGTVHNFIERRRIVHACKLLTSDMPIKQIAHRVGYADPASFSIAFRKIIGSTPSRFRQESWTRIQAR